MNERAKQLAARIADDTEVFADFFAGLTDEQMERQVYSEGAEWRVRDILGHFVTLEPSQLWLFRNIADGGPGSPEDFDLERFNRSQPKKVADVSREELLDRFRKTRAEIVAFVETLDDSTLENEGRQAGTDYGTLGHFIEIIFLHSEEHREDVMKVL